MRILIIRTIQSDLLGAFLNSLKDAFPTAEFYLLDNKKQAAFSKGQQHIQDEILWTRKAGDYGIGNLSISTISRIRALSFDTVVIPHKQSGIEGFDNVLLLLYLLKINTWLHCSIDWHLHKVSKLYLAKLLAFYCLAIPIFVMLIPITLFSFIYLFISDIFRSTKTVNFE